jgi:hypothetical protein
MNEQQMTAELMVIAKRLVDAGVGVEEAAASRAAGDDYGALMAAAVHFSGQWLDAVVERFRHLA